MSRNLILRRGAVAAGPPRNPAGPLLALLLLLAATPAAAVTLDAGTATGQTGTVVEVPVELSGLGSDSIVSYEFELRWSAGYAEFAFVNPTGTLSDGWLISAHAGDGAVRVAAAGFVPLAADGTLLKLRFQVGPGTGITNLYFAEATLNEGDPVPDLQSGSLTVTALPTLNVEPDDAVLAVGETLEFSAGGGTPPYTFTSGDPAVAAFSGDVLTALAPGRVQATARDAVGVTGETAGWIEVRPFRLETQVGTAVAGEEFVAPVVLGDATGYAIVSAEFAVEYGANALEFAGYDVTGSLFESAGWSVALSSEPGRVTVAAAGATPLSGAGPLLHLHFVATTGTGVTTTPGHFNEEYRAVPVSNYLSVTAAPVLTVTPGAAQLLVGEALEFEALGPVTPPVTWSVDDPALAGVDAYGRLRALDEGVVTVRAEDSAGVVGTAGPVAICALGLPELDATVGAGEVVVVPVTANRLLDGLGVYSLEASVSYDPSRATFLFAATSGTVSAAWGMPVVRSDPGRVSVYLAGATALEGCQPSLVDLVFQGTPDLPYPYDGFSVTNALVNEGTPCVLIGRGSPCAGGSPVPLPAPRGLALASHPNPFNPRTTLRFRTPDDGPARLAIFSARGERVRTLVDGFVTGGIEHEAAWDGRDEAGRRLASGLYSARLEAGGTTRHLKLVLLK